MAADLVFSPRGTAYRGRGRPPSPVPPQIMTALWQTYQTGTECRVSIAGDSPETVAQFRRAVRRAGSQLGVRVHIQTDRNTHEIVFWAEET